MEPREAIDQGAGPLLPHGADLRLHPGGCRLPHRTRSPRTDAIVGIGQCLSRGTLISMFLVMFVLPQILLLGDTIVEKTSFRVPRSRSPRRRRHRHGLCQWPRPGPHLRHRGRQHPGCDPGGCQRPHRHRGLPEPRTGGGETQPLRPHDQIHRPGPAGTCPGQPAGSGGKPCAHSQRKGGDRP